MEESKENLVLREDPDELVKEKPKRTMTPEASEKYALARKKAMEAKKRLTNEKKVKDKALKTTKDKILKEQEDIINDIPRPPPIKRSPRIKPPEIPEDLGEISEEDEPEPEPVIVKKKKTKKKPVVIVEQSSDSEDDSNVVYIKRKSKKSKEPLPLPPVPVYIPPPPPPKPVIDYAQLMRPRFGRY